MNKSYKIDIFEKCIEFLALFYFVFGFFTTYSWACKELDKISVNDDIKRFWDPVAAVCGLLNIANVGGIILCIYMNRKQCNNNEEESSNKENNFLFHILCTPLFFITVIYLCWDIIDKCTAVHVNGSMTIFMLISEMLLFTGAMFLILNVNKSKFNIRNVINCHLNSLVLLITIIGVLNFFIFHMTNQQIDNFINTASQFSAYNQYYNKDNIRRYNDSINFENAQDYLQPLVILFSCCCLAYLITLLYHVNNLMLSKEITNYALNEPVVSELSSRTHSEENLLIPVDNVANTPPFRLPPLSLLLGILFITITILILVIVISLTAPGTIFELQRTGESIFTLFPVLVYIISFGLLCVQINDMERWPKLRTNKNIVDKALVWIGAAGQLILSLGQVKFISCQFLFDRYENREFLFISIIILYLLLILQTLLQSLTICLALDREWMPPAIETWQEFICPPVGMLSINIGFFLFSVYAVKNDVAMNNITIVNGTNLFLKIFGNGFNSLGETLAILSRLHSSLIFGKMIAYTNKRK